jgi:hypothetical protein
LRSHKPAEKPVCALYTKGFKKFASALSKSGFARSYRHFKALFITYLLADQLMSTFKTIYIA